MAAAEALCMGVSVVGSAHLPSIRDFVSRDSGTTARRYNTKALVKALENEIREWAYGRRNPEQIADSWWMKVSARAIAKGLVNYL